MTVPRTIKVSECLITGTVNFPPIREMVLEGEPVEDGEGAFGIVYQCISVNSSQPAEKILVKILKPEEARAKEQGFKTIQTLQQALSENTAELLPAIYKKWTHMPAFRALPLFSFKGKMEGKTVCGYASFDLCEPGFKQLDKVLNNGSNENALFYKMGTEKIMAACFHILEAFSVLERIGYTHADINPLNLFIHFHRGEIALIDYDGGSLPDKKGKRVALAMGKLPDAKWLAPENYDLLKAHKDAEVIPDPDSDKWSVGILIHYLLFRMDPFYFLADQGMRGRERYLSQHPLYPVNRDYDGLTSSYAYREEMYDQQLTLIPAEIHHALLEHFTKGFADKACRLDYKEWSVLFARTQPKPQILFFRAKSRAVLKDFPAMLQWEVKGASFAFIDQGIGEVTGLSETMVSASATSRFVLTAMNHFGKTELEYTLPVFPVPIIETLVVPVPKFQLRVKLDPPQIPKSLVSQIEGTKPSIRFEPPPTFTDRMYPDKIYWSISVIFEKIKSFITSKA
jgi:serine/threonine protein kinase